QNLIKTIINVAIASGTKAATGGQTNQDKISRYLLPEQVGKLLNRENAKYMAEANNYYLGIWQPTPSKTKNQPPQTGFNSFFNLDREESGENFFNTGTSEEKKLQGSRTIAPQDFSNVQVWSLLNNYANTTINECYNTYRVASDGFVYPSLIV